MIIPAIKITGLLNCLQNPEEVYLAKLFEPYLCIIIKDLKMSFEKGIELYKDGKFQEALDVFDGLINQGSSNPQFHLFRGRVRSRLGKTELALEDFDTIVALEPYNTDYISDRAVILHLLKRNEEALSAFDQAANLDPKNPYRYSSRAFFKDRIGDLEGAIEDYEKAIELDPEDAVSYNNKGLVEEKLGYQAKSKKSFSKADELTGYEPSTAKPEGTNKIEPKVETSSDIKKPIQPEEKQEESMTFGYFLKTLKSVLFDKNSRKEFISFLKKPFN